MQTKVPDTAMNYRPAAKEMADGSQGRSEILFLQLVHYTCTSLPGGNNDSYVQRCPTQTTAAAIKTQVCAATPAGHAGVLRNEPQGHLCD
jgi:hypothetical protein